MKPTEVESSILPVQYQALELHYYSSTTLCAVALKLKD